MRNSRALALAAAFALAATPCLADVDLRKVGESITPASALTSTVESFDPDGRFVLVWQESVGPDPPEAVKAQRFAWSGPIADLITIADDASLPERDSAPGGRFLVVWRDGDPSTKYARLFERDATAAAEPFLFPDVSGRGKSLSVADDGSFVIAWKDNSHFGNVWRQRFDPSGVELESPVMIATQDAYGYDPGTTGVDHDESGDFVIAWDENACDFYYCQSCYTSIVTQRFDADGLVVGDDYRSPWMDYSPYVYPTLSVAANGPSVTNFAPHGFCFGTGWARFVRNAPEQGTSVAFTVDSNLQETHAASAINRHGEFLLAWQEVDYFTPTLSKGDIRGQLLDPVGRLAGPELLFAEGVPRVAKNARLVHLNDNGQIFASWYDTWPDAIHQRYCFDPALVLITAGSGFTRLNVLDVPEGTTRHRFRLPASRSTLPGVETVTTPHGRQALVATSGDGSTLSLFDIGNGVRLPEVDLGADRSLVPGGAPVLVDDEGELALVATQQQATGEPALHFVELSSGAVIDFIPATFTETLVPDIPPAVVSDGTAALLATNALDGASARLHRIQLLGGDAMHSVTLGPGEILERGVGPVVASNTAFVVVGTNPTGGGAPVVRVLDPVDLTIDGTFALDPGSTLQRGVPPLLSENGAHAAVATQGPVSRVRIFDLSGPSIETVIDLATDDGMVDDAGFVRGPDGNSAVLATRTPQGVWLRSFDLAAATLVHEVSLPGQGLVAGVGPTLSPSGKHAFLLTAGISPRIDRIDLTTGLADPPLLLDATETIVPGVGLRLISDESVLLVTTKNVTNSGTVLRLLDPETLSLRHRLDFGPGEQPVEGTSVVETRCGFTALLSTRGSQGQLDRVRMIDLDTGQVTRAVEMSGAGSLVRGVGPVLPASSVVGDCNANLRLDADDIAEWDSDDCDLDGTPDECQADCNGNDIADTCDIASQESDDLDGNGVPDECEPDCNENQVLDRWEVIFGFSDDCNGDGVPDECDPDCNANLIPDGCDIFEMTSPDCNGDGIPDECQPGLDSDLDGHLECSDNCPFLANATQSDFDMDGRGDACDPDGDNDGVPDLVDNCRFTSNRDQLNTDADTEGDACDDDDDDDTVIDLLDNCGVTWNPDQANGDGDPRGDLCDCDAADDTVWSVPGEARNVTFQSWGLFFWDPPGEPGGDGVLYDALRTDMATGFGAAACIRAGSPDLHATDIPAPPPDGVFYYLVRPRNGCPGGETLGSYSDGTPRSGTACP